MQQASQHSQIPKGSHAVGPDKHGTMVSTPSALVSRKVRKRWFDSGTAQALSGSCRAPACHTQPKSRDLRRSLCWVRKAAYEQGMLKDTAELQFCLSGISVSGSPRQHKMLRPRDVLPLCPLIRSRLRACNVGRTFWTLLIV